MSASSATPSASSATPARRPEGEPSGEDDPQVRQIIDHIDENLSE